MKSGSAAVVVSHNSSAAALSLAHELVNQNLSQVIIVDVGSSAPAKEELRRAILPSHVARTYIEENVGFGSAVNTGVSKLEEWDQVLICNADIELSPGCVDQLTESARAMPNTIISPIILTGSRERPVYWFYGARFVPSRGSIRMLSKGRRANLKEEGFLFTNFAPATALLVPRGVFNQIGGFREDLFMYWEDADFAIKAADADTRIVCDLGATVWHEVGGSSPKANRGSRSVGYYYYIQRNRIIVFRSRYGLFRLFLGWGLLQAFYPFWNILSKDREDAFRKIAASVAGIADGIRGVRGRWSGG